MAKKRYLRRYNTQSEYHSDINDLPEIAVSVISENKNVNYGTHYAVVINDSEAYFFEDGVIPENQFEGRTDIVHVAIGSGITQINGYAFTNCGGLTRVLIKGDITVIGERAFNYCPNLTVFDYYGTTCPTANIKTLFSGTNLIYVNVNKNYIEDTFCGLNVDKVL